MGLFQLQKDVASPLLSPLPMSLEGLVMAAPLPKTLETWGSPWEELMERQEFCGSWTSAPPRKSPARSPASWGSQPLTLYQQLCEVHPP